MPWHPSRQPEAKPPIVYSDETPGYDDSSTEVAIRETLAARSRTDQPLPHHTNAGVMHGEPETADRKKEPMPTGSSRKPREGFRLKVGEQISTIRRIIWSFEPGTRLNAALVWGLFTPTEKDRWTKAYGTHTEVLSKVKHAISNARYAGHIRLEHTDVPSTYIYVGPGKGKIQRPGPTTEKPTPIPDVHTPEGDLGDYHHIGTSLEGDPLYFDGLTNTVGTLVFTPIK